ncbi:unnamed protein product [Lactuca saligna]|uniref:Uncharacterized protein n=1 Tax=Lactuca saligna TaxID=75948 RepID=A0AA36DWG3_LACSI|nr:unnamed protein product [Lactuca saligna]
MFFLQLVAAKGSNDATKGIVAEDSPFCSPPGLRTRHPTSSAGVISSSSLAYQLLHWRQSDSPTNFSTDKGHSSITTTVTPPICRLSPTNFSTGEGIYSFLIYTVFSLSLLSFSNFADFGGFKEIPPFFNYCTTIATLPKCCLSLATLTTSTPPLSVLQLHVH